MLDSAMLCTRLRPSLLRDRCEKNVACDEVSNPYVSNNQRVLALLQAPCDVECLRSVGQGVSIFFGMLGCAKKMLYSMLVSNAPEGRYCKARTFAMYLSAAQILRGCPRTFGRRVTRLSARYTGQWIRSGCTTSNSFLVSGFCC